LSLVICSCHAEVALIVQIIYFAIVSEIRGNNIQATLDNPEPWLKHDASVRKYEVGCLQNFVLRQ
jgi:hypothetical protein